MTITKGFWRTHDERKAEVVDIGTQLAIGWINNCPHNWSLSGSSTTSYHYNLVELWIDKPKPKLRPWKPEEVPLEAWFCTKRDPRIHFKLTSFNANSGYITNADDNGWSPAEALRDLVYTRDNGKTWRPCGVEE